MLRVPHPWMKALLGLSQMLPQGHPTHAYQVGPHSIFLCPEGLMTELQLWAVSTNPEWRDNSSGSTCRNKIKVEPPELSSGYKPADALPTNGAHGRDGGKTDQVQSSLTSNPYILAVGFLFFFFSQLHTVMAKSLCVITSCVHAC